MSDKPFIKNALENIPGGFLIYRADYFKEEIIFANQKLIDMFECEDYEDFLNFTHGSFKGVVCDDDYQAAENQIKIQINSGANNFDHIQYHIITKTGRVLYVEDFGQYVESEDEGPLFYVYIVDIETKSLSYDIDHVTGLPGDRRFIEYASRLVSVINRAGNFTDFAVVYINLVGFKHFNLKYGYKNGNAFLAEFAEILNEVFSTDLVARLSDDNFAVFADYKFVTEKLDKLNSIIGEKYVKEKVRIKAGIYVLGPNDEDHFDITIDKARTACQDISDKPDISYRLYDDEMRQKRELYEYVTAHIDEAIANGWIKVYYHPVVRTLTDKICSVEALARWIDPNYGFLAPYKFIGPLEDTRQIHKLDSYMILEVCRYIRERTDNGLELLPVSFNLSRLDFMLTDAFQVVLDACKKYEIPHRLIKIEITETTVIEDPILMKEVIDKFRNNGFEIYMDDFGSGYSSLNFLKNFDFDEIKLDMQFLSDFTEKSKTVIRNSIVMAKELGIQTLAEGVETQEQYNFLKSIGCEKAQGYLFSKPLPYEEVIALMKEKGFEHEENRFRNFFDEMAKINFVTEQPVCLVHDDGEIFNFKFYNDKLEELFKKLGVETIEALTKIINSPKSLFRRTIRKNMAYLPKVIGDEKVFFYTFLGNYIRFHLKNVGQVDDNNLYWIRLDNLSTNEENKQKNNLEASMREIYHIYDSVAIFDLRDDSYSRVVFAPSIDEDTVSNNLKFTEALKVLTKSIYYLDVNRFLEFSDVKTIKQRIIHSKEGYLTDCFRFLDIHNEIIWRSIKVLSATVTDEDRFLILGRTFTDYENNYFNSIKKIIDLNETEKISDATNMDLDDIFRAVVQSSDRYFFWKDKERRFLGASQAFLDVYDIKNVAEIIGKTDEDIGWNVTELEYMNEEFDVINKGKIIRNVVGRCIIRGVPHNIACSKWPVYNKGKIVGLFGYFIDLDQEEDLLRNELGLVDTETGILNNRGFIESLMSYIAKAKSLNSSFTLIRINLNRIDEIGKLLGKEMAFAVEKEVAKTLKNFFGLSDSISHIGYGRFVILKAYMEKEKADLYCKKIEDKLLEIKEAAGVPITIYSTVTALSSAEAENSPEKLINLANLKD